MKKSQSLKERKFNIIIPKSLKNNSNVEKNENNKNTYKVIIKTIAEIPDLHLPIKKLPHVTNKKQKNPKINQISLEKLKLVVLNLRMNQNQHNKTQKEKAHNRRQLESSPTKNNHNSKNNEKICNNKTKINNQSNKILNNNINDLNANYNSENNSKNINISEININRSNSLEIDNNPNNDILQFRNKNKDKKWYNNIEYLTEKYNDLILTTENLEKNLMTKYLDGTDNIISEIEEPNFLKEDIEINTINVNASLRKHLSIRETTLDSSMHNSHQQTDKLKDKAKGYILRIKNYRKMFRKYRTNFTIKSVKENINKNKIKTNEYNKENNIIKNRKRKKKLPVFSKSLSKINNNQNNFEESNYIININNNNINNSNHEYINNRNISYDKELKDSFYTINEIKKKYKNSSSYCKHDNNKLNRLDMEQRNPSLAIIKEANDNYIIENKDSYRYRKQSAKIMYENNKSVKKNKKRENTPKEREKIKHSSDKNINNYKPKNTLIKNKPNINKYKDLFDNDEYFNNLKNNKSSIDDYIISSDLGIGSYAEVKLGIHKKTKKKYAIKIYDKNLIDDEEKKNTIKNEIFILRQLNNENENIMKLYDVINTNKYLYLILEYINGISLLEFLQKRRKRRIEENLCKNIFHQIVKAILYCQNKHICHRDIKLENILIIKDNIIKLIDFGFAVKCSKNEYQEFYCGTLYYMPPEIVNKQKYIPFYSDIWSLGVLLYAMLFGRFPFKSNKEEKLFELINEGKLIFPNNIEVSDEAKILLNKIIVLKPSKRLSLEEILNDPWFRN